MFCKLFISYNYNMAPVNGNKQLWNLICIEAKSLNDLYQQAISKKSRSIVNDPTHPLHSCYEIMPSGKRYRTPAFKRQLYNKSFILSAVRFLNSQKNL